MRTKLIAIVIMTILALPAGAFAKSGDWWKPGSWFSKKSRSTTITGVVDSVAEGKVMFKTLDGQTLQLTGDSAAKVGESRSVKIRIFGNVVKPDQKFPSGAVQVRSFKVLEEAPVVAAEPEPAEPTYEPEPYVEPEPVEEPAADVPEPVAAADDDDEAPFVDDNANYGDEPVADAAVEEKTYVVSSGDTLGKISQKLYGTTGKWKKIAEHNGITNPKLLKVGMTLRIP